jgi:hypothetical protein
MVGPSPHVKLTPGMQKMISALMWRPLRFNEWLAQAKVSKRYFLLYLDKLVDLRYVNHDDYSSRYRLTEEGRNRLWIQQTTNLLERCGLSRSSFKMPRMPSGNKKSGAGPTDEDFALVSGFAFDSDPGVFHEIFDRKMEFAAKMLLEEICRSAVEKGLVADEAPTLDPKRFVSIERKRRKQILKKLCPKGNHIVYIEKIDLKVLQDYLTHIDSADQLPPQMHLTMSASPRKTAPKTDL